MEMLVPTSTVYFASRVVPEYDYWGEICRPVQESQVRLCLGSVRPLEQNHIMASNTGGSRGDCSSGGDDSCREMDPPNVAGTFCRGACTPIQYPSY